MSLEQKITELISAIASDIKSLNNYSGLLSNLTTADKTSLVAAINEINTSNNKISITPLDIDGVSWAIIDSEDRVLLWGSEFPSDYNFEELLNKEIEPLSVISHNTTTVTGGMYNQWIWPIFLELSDEDKILGSVIGAGVTNNYGSRLLGRVAAVFKPRYGSISSVDFDRIRGVAGLFNADDHNCAAISVDTRTDAEEPISTYRTEHNGYMPVVFSTKNKNLSYLNYKQTLPVADTSYSQVFRNPNNLDEILYITRSGGISNAAWYFNLSINNGKSWSSYRTLTGSDLYVLCKESLDGNSLHIGAHEHPLSGTDQRILFMKFSWIDKSIRFPGSITPLVGDIRTSLEANVFDNAESFSVYTPDAGRRTRLYDLHETTSNKIEIVLADFSTDSIGSYKHVSLNDTDLTVTVNDLGDCGSPIEIPAGGNAYFAGVCVHGVNKVVTTKWLPTDHANGIGTSLMELKTLTNDVWDSQILLTANNNKIFRPLNINRVWRSNDRQYSSLGQSITYIDGRYNSYRDFSTSVNILTP